MPSTPDVPKVKPAKAHNVNSTTKKTKGMSVTELVEIMKSDVDVLTKAVDNETVEVPKKAVVKKIDVCVTPNNITVKKLSFMGSLAGMYRTAFSVQYQNVKFNVPFLRNGY